MVASVRNRRRTMQAEITADIRELSDIEIGAISGGADNTQIGNQVVDGMLKTIGTVNSIIYMAQHHETAWT
jgi:hypothetical protein